MSLKRSYLVKGSHAFFILLLCLCACIASDAQDQVVKAVQLQEFIISADDDFDTEDFMEIVMTDSSFYQSFLNLKYYPHAFDSKLLVFDKKERDKGTLDRTANQYLEDGLRWVEVTSETSNGKVYKRNGEHKYLTAEMYDELFFEEGKERPTLDIVEYEQKEVKGNRIDRYKSQLKKMMFNPGQSISSVPLVGKKMAIFSDEMAKYYDYSIYSAYDNDSVYCYVFQVDAKPEFGKNKTVIKSMISYFSKADMNVLHREYRLSNNTALFQFDIYMKVDNYMQDGVLLPSKIKYVGDWDIPFKSPEIIRFDIDCSDYRLE